MPTRQTGKRSLPNRARNITFDPPHEEALAKDWTLSERDGQYLAQYRKANRLTLAIQLCTLRLYGRFMADITNLAPQVLAYLAQQLHLTSLPVDLKPLREATWIAQQQQLLQYLNFRRLTATDKKTLHAWIRQQILGGLQPPAIVPLAEQYLLQQKIVLPGAIVLQRQIVKYYKQYQQQ